MTDPHRPSSPLRQRTWLRRGGETLLVVAVALSINGWKDDSCDNKKDILNPVNADTATRLYVDVQPPELRRYVDRIAVRAYKDSTTTAQAEVTPGTNPTIVDINPKEGTVYRIQARDACNNVLAESEIGTGIRTAAIIGPDELRATVTLREGFIPACPPSPSPSPSSSASPSPRPSTSPSPVAGTSPTPDPEQSRLIQAGGSTGGGAPPPATANVTVNLNGLVQQGRHTPSEGRLATPTPSGSSFMSPSPSPSGF